MSIADIMAMPGRDLLVTLSPDLNGKETWFRQSTNGITKAIKRMIQTQLEIPHPTYRSMPQEDRDRWFRTFAQEFNWDPAITHLVRKLFDKQAATSYSKHVNEWKQRWNAGKDRLPWVNESVWEGFIAYWQQERTQTISTINSHNRRSDRGGKGIATHNAGARTFETVEREMTLKDGKRPDFLKMMIETHTSKKSGRIEDAKALAIVEKCKRRKTEVEQQLSATGSTSEVPRETVNKLVLEETEVEKGRTFGLGELTLFDPVQAATTTESPLVLALRDELNEEKERRRSLEGTFADFRKYVESKLGVTDAPGTSTAPHRGTSPPPSSPSAMI